MQKFVSWYRVFVPLLLGAMTVVAPVSHVGADERADERPVVFLAEASITERDDATALAILGAAEVLSEESSSVLRRLFSTLKPIAKKAIAKAVPSPIVTAALPDRSIVIAEASPNFGRWQERANSRLNQEKSLLTRTEHPQAIAHPDSYVTVCEAGCRGKPDQIVYAIVKTEAASAGPAPYVPTDSSSEPPPSAGATAAADMADADITCVAGCYDSPKKFKARQTAQTAVKKAAAAPVSSRAIARQAFNPARAVTKAAVARALNKSVSPRRAMQIGYNGAIVSGEPQLKKDRRAAASKAIVRVIASRLEGTSAGWRTRVIKASARNVVR